MLGLQVKKAFIYKICVYIHKILIKGIFGFENHSAAGGKEQKIQRFRWSSPTKDYYYVRAQYDCNAIALNHFSAQVRNLVEIPAWLLLLAQKKPGPANWNGETGRPVTSLWLKFLNSNYWFPNFAMAQSFQRNMSKFLQKIYEFIYVWSTP